MFCPATDIDRDLILAFFVTPFWGGRYGSRPLFAVTSETEASDPEDINQKKSRKQSGRGTGKTTLVAKVGNLAGGHFEFSLNDDVEIVKKRLLSSEFLTSRVALIDNAKSNRVSHADYESLVTCQTISGQKMYVGEARRPNNLTWAITLNGASFSTDIAQRAVVIKLKRPVYSGTWESNVQNFIDDHRVELISDCIGFLQSEAAHIENPDRWGAWCCEVLARLPEPADALKTIGERRVATDSERGEAAEVEDDFSRRLIELHYDPDTDRIFIPAHIAGKWCRESRNELRESANATGRWLKQQIEEQATRFLSVAAGRAHGRGYLWTGGSWDESDTKLNLEAQIEAVEAEKRRQWDRSW